jgi:predicted transcriptional regulator
VSDTAPLPSELSDARSSTLHIYEILDTETWTTDESLRQRTNYGRHCVSRACRDLQGAGLAQRRRNPDDPQHCETKLLADGD